MTSLGPYQGKVDLSEGSPGVWGFPPGEKTQTKATNDPNQYYVTRRADITSFEPSVLVNRHSSWGILPQTPVFSLRLAPLSLVELDHCSVLEILTGWTGPNDLLPATMSSLGKLCRCSAPSEARKRGSGGESPRKYDALRPPAGKRKN
jgi:hypothetical protein